MPSALLVCGSRSLITDPDGLAWVADTLRAVLSPRPDLLIHGGARGPDELAGEEGARVGVPEMLVFYPTGRLSRCVAGTYRGEGVAHVATYTSERWRDGDPGPLVRNKAMVAHLSGLVAAGWTARVVGLVDAASPTRGTDHTLRHARAAGLTVERLAWERPR